MKRGSESDGAEYGEDVQRAVRIGGLGKSLTQLQAEAMAERRFTDLMASAGVSQNRMSQEVLFFLPRGFVDTYQQLFIQAFGGKDDGGVNARGQAQAESGVLQKGKAAAREGKRFKRHWVIADDHAVNVKDRVDKRLRAMAREITEELADAESRAVSERRGMRLRCSSCGRLLREGWKFCPYDGSRDDGGEG